MTNTQLLLKAFGCQGGTIHQLSDMTGLATDQILDLDQHGMSNTGLGSDYMGGWSSYRTCSVEFNIENNFPKHLGNVDYWKGVLNAVKSLA